MSVLGNVSVFLVGEGDTLGVFLLRLYGLKSSSRLNGYVI